MNSELDTKKILPNSKMPVSKGTKNDKGRGVRPINGPKYDAPGQIKKFGLSPTEKLEYKDMFTGETKSIMIDRRGTTDEKLAIALLDDNVTREQKDSMLSMYLFEQGKHGASMLMDLWAYKGAHTKESRAFQSTMRFDFELFLQVFQTFMMDSADLIFNNLPLEVVTVDIEGGKQKEMVRLTGNANIEAEDIALVLGEFALYHRMTSELLGKRIRAEVEKRERAKGKGIYLAEDGKPYSIHEDADIVDVVKKDKDEADAKKHGTN